MASKEVAKTLFGKTDDGEEVFKFTLVNNNGVTLDVINYGAITTAIKCPDRNGKVDDIMLGFDDFEGFYHRNASYFGCTVGRVCNRISNASFEIDDQTYQLSVNDPPNSLHGGFKGFDKFVWEYDIGENSVTFSRTSKDGEEGYPGNLQISVSYALNDDNEIHYDVKATTDKATIINITNHSYFNLAGQVEGDVLQHVAEIKADAYLPNNSTNAPTGEIVSVKDDPPFDFTTPKEFGKDIRQTPHEGYDHNYCITNPGHVDKLVARVTETNSGRVLEVYTTQPGVQLYTANGFDGTLVGKNNILYKKYAAFCLETQNYPDAINQANFPSPILRPGETYHHVTVYKVSVVS